ncbi:MAG: hypothetical protein Q9226_007720 [Calogaya cf. arnoldii]
MIHVLQWGGGRDLWNVSESDWKLFKLHFRNTQIIARIGMCFTKISFLLFYQRLFFPKGARRTPVWWAIWLCFWVNVLYAISLIITVTTQCVGKAAIVAAGGQCVNEYAVLICASVINVFSDLVILVIPIVCIWGLHLPADKKRKLSAVFVIGGLAVLASIARLGYQIVESDNPNQSLAIMIVSQLNLAEQFIGVIVSCMPILPAFYRHLRRSAAASANGNPKGGLTASILVFQKPKVISTKRSKTKDPFPVYSTTDEDVTTRGGEELDDLEAQSKPRVMTIEWKTPQWQDVHLTESTQHILGVSPKRSYDPTRGSVKNTEIDARYRRASLKSDVTL